MRVFEGRPMFTLEQGVGLTDRYVEQNKLRNFDDNKLWEPRTLGKSLTRERLILEFIYYAKTTIEVLIVTTLLLHYNNVHCTCSTHI